MDKAQGFFIFLQDTKPLGPVQRVRRFEDSCPYFVLYDLNDTIVDSWGNWYVPVAIERTFTQGRLVLSHVRSRLSVQSTHALLCVGVWSVLGYVKDSDAKAVAAFPEVDGKEDELTEGWDSLDTLDTLWTRVTVV